MGFPFILLTIGTFMTDVQNNADSRLAARELALKEENEKTQRTPSDWDLRVAKYHQLAATTPFVSEPIHTACFPNEKTEEFIYKTAIALLHLENWRMGGASTAQVISSRRKFWEGILKQDGVISESSLRYRLGNFTRVDRPAVKFVSACSHPYTPTIATLPKFSTDDEHFDPEEQLGLWTFTTPVVTNAYYHLKPSMVEKYADDTRIDKEDLDSLEFWLSQGVDFYMILPNLPFSMWTDC